MAQDEEVSRRIRRRRAQFSDVFPVVAIPRAPDGYSRLAVGVPADPLLQLLTIADLLNGKGIDYARTAGVNQTFKKAPKATRKQHEPEDLFSGK